MVAARCVDQRVVAGLAEPVALALLAPSGCLTTVPGADDAPGSDEPLEPFWPQPTLIVASERAITRGFTP